MRRASKLTTVMNLVAMLDEGVEWSHVEAICGGRLECRRAIKEAVRRNLIKIIPRADGVQEIEVLEPHKTGERKSKFSPIRIAEETR